MTGDTLRMQLRIARSEWCAVTSAAQRSGLSVVEWAKLMLLSSAGYESLVDDLARARAAGQSLDAAAPGGSP